MMIHIPEEGKVEGIFRQAQLAPSCVDKDDMIQARFFSALSHKIEVFLVRVNRVHLASSADKFGKFKGEEPSPGTDIRNLEPFPDFETLNDLRRPVPRG